LCPCFGAFFFFGCRCAQLMSRCAAG
jgi:hypothetical protein